MTNRLIITLLLAALGLRIIFATPAARPLSGNELCADIRQELDRSVEYGVLSQEEADYIARRCYQRHGGPK